MAGGGLPSCEVSMTSAIVTNWGGMADQQELLIRLMRGGDFLVGLRCLAMGTGVCKDVWERGQIVGESCARNLGKKFGQEALWEEDLWEGRLG